MPEPSPLKKTLPPGKYAICRCGQTDNAPLCDGSHKGSTVTPELVTFEAETKYAWCRCRESGTLPQCDGTHAKRGPGPGA